MGEPSAGVDDGPVRGRRGAPGVGGRLMAARWRVGSSSGSGGREGKLGRGRPGEGGGMLLVALRASSVACFARLWSFQHAGQRHSMLNWPSAVRVRVSRQPNWELMRV